MKGREYNDASGGCLTVTRCAGPDALITSGELRSCLGRRQIAAQPTQFAPV